MELINVRLHRHADWIVTLPDPQIVGITRIIYATPHGTYSFRPTDEIDEDGYVIFVEESHPN